MTIPNPSRSMKTVRKIVPSEALRIESGRAADRVRGVDELTGPPGSGGAALVGGRETIVPKRQTYSPNVGWRRWGKQRRDRLRILAQGAEQARHVAWLAPREGEAVEPQQEVDPWLMGRHERGRSVDRTGLVLEHQRGPRVAAARLYLDVGLDALARYRREQVVGVDQAIGLAHVHQRDQRLGLRAGRAEGEQSFGQRHAGPAGHARQPRPRRRAGGTSGRRRRRRQRLPD